MSQDEPNEGRAGVNRIEAFSDGVIAIIITIMVLELKAPSEDGFAAFWHLWPVFFAYLLSYNYIAIYWVNHHRLFSHARVVSNGLIWANINLLLSLSLVPFATSYLGEHLVTQTAAIIYLVSLLIPSLMYIWLASVIRRTGSQTPQSQLYHRAMARKGIAASTTYALAIPLSLWSPSAGITCAGLVAVFWILPWGPLDRMFLGYKDTAA